MMRRNRRAKIVATLGPASSDATIIRRLFEAGVHELRLRRCFEFLHGRIDNFSQLTAAVGPYDGKIGRWHQIGNAKILR